MKTKNLFKTMSVLVVLVFALIVSAFQASAQSFYAADFLAGTDMRVGGASTNYYGSTNEIVKFGSLYGPAYITNSAMAYNWVTNSKAIQDVAFFADRDGLPTHVSLSAHVYSTGVWTNPVIFKFSGVPRGVGEAVSLSAQNQFQFAVSVNGTNDVVISTNFPTAAFQGCGAIRLTAVGQASGTTNVWVKYVALTGFRP